MDPKNRKKWKSKKYSKWIHDYYHNEVNHHLGHSKHNDLMQIPMTQNEHLLVHTQGEDYSQEVYNKDYLWELINTLMDFVVDQCKEFKDEK